MNLEQIKSFHSRVKKVDTILVDLDGTLVGLKEVPLYLSFIRHLSIELEKRAKIGTRQSIKLLYGMNQVLSGPTTKQTNYEKLLHWFGNRPEFQNLDYEKVVLEAIKTVFPVMKKHSFPIKKAQKFIAGVQDRYRLILATNPVWPVELVQQRLEWAGISPNVFSSITHAKRMRSSKGKVAFYQELLDQESLDPSQCLMVGNKSKYDGNAIYAGICCFIVNQHKDLRIVDVGPKGIPMVSGTYEQLGRMLS